MGRKLNALEEIQAAIANSDAERLEGRAQLQKQLLERIAGQLGITTAELGGHPAPPNAIHPAIDIARQSDLVVTQECAELVKAFVQIQDPHDRLRCLQIVREIAEATSPGSAR